MLNRIRSWFRSEKSLHNDRDAYCIYWWGDRGGSAVGVTNERCGVCRSPRFT